jgi:proton glutamate symport protein
LAGYAKEVTGRIVLAQEQKEAGPLQAMEDIVPSNIFLATSDNTKMLQVIFFAIFFGISLILIPSENANSVKDFFDGFNDVILKMIDIIMTTAPYGVFALMAALVVESPDSNLFSALGLYAITVIACLFVMLRVYAAIVYISSRTNPKQYFKAIAPAQCSPFQPVPVQCRFSIPILWH